MTLELLNEVDQEPNKKTFNAHSAVLKIFYYDFIAKYPSIIFESAEFTSLHESALISILKQMKELENLACVIKWGNYALPEKFEEWLDEISQFKNNSTTMLITYSILSQFFEEIKVCSNDVLGHLHKHANAIVVTRVKGTGEIIDGFNPLARNKLKTLWLKTRLYVIMIVKIDPYFGCDEFTTMRYLSNFTQDKQNRCYSFIINNYYENFRL
ncbi:hypothetical protein Glove_217g69 [Diversispora epigaea]|uniref:BTB domain-containing protein n=1 Tax=Diversispora epigaea TaxID=1348612 RepID=A0A397IQ97_9GLOM|nr:hypothetical protein Glove_217g69 [Diversispora epigaea]